MQENERQTFNRMLVVMAEGFDQQLSEPKMLFYWQALKDLSMKQVEQGLSAVARSARFFPKPAEIREAVFGNTEDRAQVAIGKIEQALRKYSAYESIIFDDPLLHHIIAQFGGWIKLCETLEKEWKWIRKDFIAQYQAIANLHSAHVDCPPVLKGIHADERNEQMLGAIGRKLQIHYVGDKAKALAWSQPLAVEHDERVKVLNHAR